MNKQAPEAAQYVYRFNPRCNRVELPREPRRTRKVWAILGVKKVWHVTTGMSKGGCSVDGTYWSRKGVADMIRTARAVRSPIYRMF